MRWILIFVAGLLAFLAFCWWQFTQSADEQVTRSNIESMRSEWLEQARQCDRNAMMELRFADELERLFSRNVETAPPSLIERAEGGEAEAEAVLAIFNASNGDEVISDEELGRRLMAAAERGSATAQNEIGYAYIHGDLGLEQNPQQAEMWLTRSAMQGEHIAMVSLARAYSDGVIQPVDGEERTQRQAASDAALMAAAHCNAYGLFLAGSLLGDPNTEPYDPEASRQFLLLVPEEPMSNYPEF